MPMQDARDLAVIIAAQIPLIAVATHDETRRIILSIHLQKRDLDPADFDLDALAAASDGFSGAEIEQAIVSGCYSAMSSSGDPGGDALMAELLGTAPLSVVMAEKLDGLWAWARQRNLRQA